MSEKQEKLALRIADACEALSLSRSSLYNLIREGQLKSVKIAGRTLILRSEIERLLSEVANDA